MQVLIPGQSRPLRGDVLVRVVLRSDLTPIPQTVEIEVRDVAETAPMAEGMKVKVGRELLEFDLVKEGGQRADGYSEGSRTTGTRTFIGLLASCAPLSRPLQRAVVRYGASLGDIYRACGARAPIESDIQVPVFACLRGMVPTFEIAKALYEGAAVITCIDDGRVSFRRLADIAAGKAMMTMKEDSAERSISPFLERHLVPFTFTTDPNGAILAGKVESGRTVVHRPFGTQDVLNNMSSALITRRKVESGFAPDLMAGQNLKLAGAVYTVVTAAHVFTAGGRGADGAQTSTFWLAQYQP
jgi:hypothetical protein